jgi:hypothetical protein
VPRPRFGCSRVELALPEPIQQRKPIPDRLEVSVKLILLCGHALVIFSLQGIAGAQTLHASPVEIGGQTGLIGVIAAGYFVQYKRTTRRPYDWSGTRPFFTAGTGGYYSYRKISELRLPRPDGSVVVYPAHSSGELSRLAVAAFGGGFERGLNRYASFRLEGSGFAPLHSDGYLGFRVLAGISVPIGGYRVRSIPSGRRRRAHLLVGRVRRNDGRMRARQRRCSASHSRALRAKSSAPSRTVRVGHARGARRLDREHRVARLVLD